MERSHAAGRVCALALALAVAFAAAAVHGAVKSSVFDDVKVWYKGSAGNAVGTADAGSVTKVKSLPQLADASSAMHGGDYFWWGWRMQYENQDVECPYAGCKILSTPCMVVPKAKWTVNGVYSNDPENPTGYADVEINGVVYRQPYYDSPRFGDLHFSNWMSDWAADAVCSNYTCVLRFRSDMLNPVSGNGSKIIEIGSWYDDTVGRAAGFSLILNPNAQNFAEAAYPRIWVGKAAVDYRTCNIKSGRWVDCAIAVNGRTLNMWLCWNDGTIETPTNRLVRTSETYPTTASIPTIQGGSIVYLASTKNAYSGGVYTNGLYSSDLANKAFEGAFHQIAFWDRTLSDDEIREAMAGGTGRPNIVQVGIEGNGIEEFATSAQTSSVSNTGAWENLNPTLTAANPSATIAFTCPALWAGKPQCLRVPIAATSTEGILSVALNGEVLGKVEAVPGDVAFLYVQESKVVSGDNTLVLTRTEGESIVLDAVTLGGSWQFGENVGSFGYQSDVTSNPDRYVFNPACGSDEIHHRGTFNSGSRETDFFFFVPADMVGKFRGVFTTRTQNTGWPTAAEMPYSFHVNGTKIGDFTLKGGTETRVKISDRVVVAGWNRAYWKTTSNGYWANIDWHRFELKPPPPGMTMIIR
ncbi:MAG: hypothetical protein IKE55_01160 [Kiritimatiellae bacterium]|nr:hypothetical protein [Kiritimatiellia bacterium]